jgi:thiamine biosynthesis lipoprotein
MTLTRRRFLAGSTASVWAAVVPARAAATSTIGGPAFGSYWRVSLDRAEDFHAVQRRIRAIVSSLNDVFSPYDSRSELSVFNALRTTDWTPASPALRTVLRAALRIAATSDGAFDPSVGPIVGRYGFGPIRGASDVAYRQLAVGTGGIRKEIGRINIDLCGIAKGYALDRIREALDELGIDNFLIELGGEVCSQGRHPAGRRWQVAIEDPVPSGTLLQHLIALEGRAIATSGVTAKSYEVAGRRYSHIIDARRRAPVNGDIVSASVLSHSAMEADGLATTLVAMQLNEATALAETLDLDAAIHLRDGDALKTVMTGRFTDWLIG